jgi:transcriptional regulator with PAS, ATPase and Fis domain
MSAQSELHHRKVIKQAWLNFVKNRPVQPGVIRPEIMESWIRCRDHGVDPYLKSLPDVLSKKQTDELISRNMSLINVARDILKRFYHYIKNMDVIIVLMDKDGYILDTMGDGPIWKHSTYVMEAVPGRPADESYSGTNAPFMALLLDKPYEMVAEESYTKAFHPGLTVAAPIHDAGGEINGCLGMAFSHETASRHPHTLAMVNALAGIIENQVQLIHSMEKTDFISRSLKSAMASMNDGLIIINKDDTILYMNTMAETLLGVKLDDVVDQKIGRIIRSDVILNTIRRRELMTDQEVILDESPGRPRCLISFNPIINSRRKHVGGTLFLKEFKFVQSLMQKVVGLKAHYTFDDIWGDSPEIGEVIRVAHAMANSTSNVVIIGESGTGKELIAQSIHNAGFSASGPFMAINCAAIPYDLIESEIFGYEAGTFTGGLRQGKAGKLELVKGGTLFLDEINGMSMDMQAKLLRILEEKQFQRLGGNKYIPLEARIISATNQDLLERVKHGNFRNDLYYRLSVIEIHIPPLRMRKKDIEILVQRFIDEKNRQLGKAIKGISGDALEYLLSYPWPGNVRELKNWIERAVNLAAGDILTRRDFPQPAGSGDVMQDIRFLHDGERGKGLSDLERTMIRTVIEDCKGNILQASRRLGIGRSTLYRKMDKYGISLSRNVR